MAMITIMLIFMTIMSMMMMMMIIIIIIIIIIITFVRQLNKNYDAISYFCQCCQVDVPWAFS